MSWLALGTAIVAEIVATSALKQSDGFTRILPSLLVVAGYGIAFFALSIALRHLSLSVSYAIWSGIGTAAIAAIGMVRYGESAAAVRLVGIACIAVGCVVVNLKT